MHLNRVLFQLTVKEFRMKKNGIKFLGLSILVLFLIACMTPSLVTPPAVQPDLSVQLSTQMAEAVAVLTSTPLQEPEISNVVMKYMMYDFYASSTTMTLTLTKVGICSEPSCEDFRGADTIDLIDHDTGLVFFTNQYLIPASVGIPADPNSFSGNYRLIVKVGAFSCQYSEFITALSYEYNPEQKDRIRVIPVLCSS